MSTRRHRGVKLCRASTYGLVVSGLSLAAGIVSCSGGPDEVTNVPSHRHLGYASILLEATVCPSITEFTVSPSSVVVGAEMQLIGAGESSQGPVSILWTTTSGVIANPSAPTTTLRCTAPGVASLSLTVYDGSCPTSVTIGVECTPACPADASCDGG